MPSLKKLKAAFASKPDYPPVIFRRKSTLTFGKYQGLTVQHVLDVNPGYIYWLIHNTKVKFSKKVIELAESAHLLSCCDRPPRTYRPSYNRSSYYRHADWDHDEYSDWGPGEFDGGGNMGFW